MQLGARPGEPTAGPFVVSEASYFHHDLRSHLDAYEDFTEQQQARAFEAITTHIQKLIEKRNNDNEVNE